MKLQLINPNYPVWEVTNFNLPEIQLTGIETYDQQYTSQTSHLRQQCKPDTRLHNAFSTVWNDHTKILEKFIRKEMNDIEEVRQMWMKTLSNFTYPPFSVSGEFIQDEEGFNMAPSNYQSKLSCISSLPIFKLCLTRMETKIKTTPTKF